MCLNAVPRYMYQTNNTKVTLFLQNHVHPLSRKLKQTDQPIKMPISYKTLPRLKFKIQISRIHPNRKERKYIRFNAVFSSKKMALEG